MPQGGKKVDDFLYEKETYLIRGACFEVWKEFKGMFKEKVIERALCIAIKNKGLDTESQKRIDIYFQNEKVGTYVPDIIVNKIILIELKSKPQLTKQDEEQFWKYLKGSKYKLGLLINFSPHKLIIKRVVFDTARDKHPLSDTSA
jgi:GxxExxY protein